MNILARHNVWLVLGLVFLMAATRYHHFGDALHLPDASLAIFFAAGFFLSSRLVFPALLVEAGLIDYFAITVGGVSDWCVTPAYWFLIPTYGVLWMGGRWLRSRVELSWLSLARFAVVSTVCASMAFFISNGAFYLFSGRFTALSAAQYVDGVAQYYPSYVTNALAYLALFGFLYGVFFLLKRRRLLRENAS